MEIRVHTKTIAVRKRTGCGQELSGMNQEWSGMISLKNCRVIAGLLTKKQSLDDTCNGNYRKFISGGFY